MNVARSLLLLAAFGTLTATPKLWADPVLAVNAGATGGVLAETIVGGVYTWVYTDTNAAVYSLLPPSSAVGNQTFTAVFSDVGGVPLLNVTDVCANVDVNAPAIACKGLAFTFTDLGLGTPVLQSNLGLLGVLGLNLDVDTVGLNVAADIGGGSANIGFTNPPAATPEPGTLGLLGSGVLGMAGIVRKKYMSA